MVRDPQPNYEARRVARWAEVAFAGAAGASLFSAGMCLGEGSPGWALLSGAVFVGSAVVSAGSRGTVRELDAIARQLEERHGRLGEANARQDKRLDELDKHIAESAGNARKTSVSSRLSSDPGRHGAGHAGRPDLGRGYGGR